MFWVIWYPWACNCLGSQIMGEIWGKATPSPTKLKSPRVPYSHKEVWEIFPLEIVWEVSLEENLWEGNFNPPSQI